MSKYGQGSFAQAAASNVLGSGGPSPQQPSSTYNKRPQLGGQSSNMMQGSKSRLPQPSNNSNNYSGSTQ